MYLHNKDKTDFDQKTQELRFLTQNLSLKHLRNRSVDFYFEIEGLIQAVEREINTYCLSRRGGIDILQREIDHLSEQDFQLTANIAKLYILVEKEKKEQTQKIILKQVGFVGGGWSTVFCRSGALRWNIRCSLCRLWCTYDGTWR
ncbi:DUF4225 domain-containing protein [Brenneria tiliae]|uniref:DUF4225 domain-containing protein n=1 Tax=Brenneria tiliae TaxID=2914984 RepID=UPI002014A430|nr:DUF4225 domain-containing protein [Brenneria tiliae]MCL2899902.1 DUF4225 domain-containing protein [Brenneria tiliae]